MFSHINYEEFLNHVGLYLFLKQTLLVQITSKVMNDHFHLRMHNGFYLLIRHNRIALTAIKTLRNHETIDI